MNELIQKLAEESGLDAKTMGFQNNHTEQWNARVSKLTQLIVEECSGVCLSRAAGYHVNHLIPDEAIFCSIYIKRHFGVEE
jgi:hypothetical protein